MPNEGGIAARYTNAAIQEADTFLTRNCSATRLSKDQVQSYSSRSLQAGWQASVDTGASIRRVDICVDPLFPFSPPHFFLVDRPNFLTWPHVEEDGRLCLLNEDAVTDFRRPSQVIGELLGNAFRLICESESGANEDDFRTEFYSYWNRSLLAETPKIRSLLRLNGRSRLVQIWRGKAHSVV